MNREEGCGTLPTPGKAATSRKRVKYKSHDQEGPKPFPVSSSLEGGKET